MLFSRFASPHVNIRLDWRPVSSSVALLDSSDSEGALLIATGNKVSTEPPSEINGYGYDQVH